MTFTTLAAYVRDELRSDGDSPFVLPTSTPYYSTAFGIRLISLLAQFTRDTKILFTAGESITVASGDWQFDFADSANCAKVLFEVHRIWLNKILLTRRASASEILAVAKPFDNSGTPSSWARLGEGKIIFDKTVDSTIANSYAQGFYLHPAIASDSATVYIPDQHIDLFARYACAYIRSNVASDEVGLTRLARADAEAARAVKRLRADSIMYHAQVLI